MDPYRFSSHPPLISAYNNQSYIGSPHHSLIVYQQPNMTPYTMPNEYMTPIPSQMYLQTPPAASIHHQPFVGGGLPPYGHPLYDEEPSCFESLLENLCCCFGFGAPQNHYEAMQKREMQHRRLIAKEERNRLAQFQKIQEKQRQAQIQQQQLATKNNTVTAADKTNTATKATGQQPITNAL